MTRFLNALLYLLAFPAACCATEEPVLVSSKNGSFVALISRASETNQCHVSVFGYAQEKTKFSLVRQLTLPNHLMPVEAILSSSGRFLVGLGDFASGVADTPAISITDLRNGEQAVFSYSNFLSKEAFKEFVRRPPYWQRWLNHIYVDEGREQVFVIAMEAKHDGDSRSLAIKVDCPRASVGVDSSFHTREIAKLLDRQRKFKDICFASDDVMLFHGFNRLRHIAENETIDHFYRLGGQRSLLRFGRGKGERKANLLHFQVSPQLDTIFLVGQIEMPNEELPSNEYVWIAPDSKYAVTFDEIDRIGSTNLVVIIDLTAKTAKGFDLEAISTPDVSANIFTYQGKKIWRFGSPWFEFAGGAKYESTRDTNTLVPKLILDLEARTAKLVGQ